MSVSTPVKSGNTLNQAGHVFNGIAANAAMLVVMNPAFVAKTYFQKGMGMPPFAAWGDGFKPNCVGVLPAQAVAFLTNAIVKNQMSGMNPTFASMSAAVAAGVASSPFAAGFERVTILQQIKAAQKKELKRLGKLQEAEYIKLGAFDLVKETVAKEGRMGLIKGLSPTLVRDVEFLAGLFFLQDFVKKWLAERVSNEKTCEIAASFSTGFVIGFLTNPVDMLKTRMQSVFVANASFFGTFKQVVSQEGAKAPLKGALARSILIGGAMVWITQAKQFFPVFYPDFLHQKRS